MGIVTVKSIELISTNIDTTSILVNLQCPYGEGQMQIEVPDYELEKWFELARTPSDPEKIWLLTEQCAEWLQLDYIPF